MWSEYCDWALEMEKPRLHAGDEGERRQNARILAWVLERTLRMLHPIMPFLTEELWQRFGDGSESIVRAPVPERHPEHRDSESEEAFGWLQRLVEHLREVRARLPAGVPFSMTVGSGRRNIVGPYAGQIERMTGAAIELSGERDPEWRVDIPAEFPVAPDRAGFVRCLPHVHGTDGFTAIRLVRVTT